MTLKIEHIAIWTKNIERMRDFYEKYFGATSNKKYNNPAKHFSSYFLTFSTGARLELMQRQDIQNSKGEADQQYLGYAHLAISVGSKNRVNDLTAQLNNDGFILMDGPRTTGDGYYESVILDPDGNRIEITE